MNEATNIFHVSKKENIDTFVRKFLGENECCDRVEITEKNDAYEVHFFPKEKPKMEAKKMSEQDKTGVLDVGTLFLKAIQNDIQDGIQKKTAAIEEQMNAELEKVKKKSAELDVTMATIQKNAKEKLASLDATINQKFNDQDKKINEKIDAVKKDIEDKNKKTWEVMEKIATVITNEKPKS